MPRITIDGKSFDVREGKNLLEACLSNDIDLPYFCWHPALGSVGACRQCAVIQYKDENDKRGKLIMACMTPVTDGLHASVEDPKAKTFRASATEWLMLNHPHDCPVCDEGGECHLQDMTVMTGHTYRRNRFKKRTFQNQDLGPFLNHEMNRCIACYRCVRFYRDYARGNDLNVFSAHDRVYFGREESGPLESEFSGNLVEICPTGVFTDKTLKRHYTRKWDLATAPSICPHCSIGCNTIPGERQGLLRRVRNRYHEEINGYFLCDRGRYGYEFVNDGPRSTDILTRDADSTIQALGSFLKASLNTARVIGIGSPRASMESNFALRELVGKDQFFEGFAPLEGTLVKTAIEILSHVPAHSEPLSATIKDAELADAVLILGEDITQTAPRLALALRQTPRPLASVTPHRTKIDEVASSTVFLPVDDIARFGHAIAHALNGTFPEPDGLPAALAEQAKATARKLAGARRPFVVTGTGLRSIPILQAASNVVLALEGRRQTPKLWITLPEANSAGLGLFGGRSLSDLEELRAPPSHSQKPFDAVIVLENDLFRRLDHAFVDFLFSQTRRIIVFDHVLNETTARADNLFPSASFAESDGTFVNNEGRAQRFYRVFAPRESRPGVSRRASWRWIRDLMIAAGRPDAESWKNLDSLVSALVSAFPSLAALADAAPPADFRLQGRKLARQTHRASGRTALFTDRSIHDPAPPTDPDTPFSFSMEGFEPTNGRNAPPSALLPRYWSPGWNSVQSLNKFQMEVGGLLQGGPAGKRLFALQRGPAALFREIPPPFSPKRGQWLSVPLYHLFGSEELSSRSRAIQTLAPRPYVALNPDDAADIGISEGELLNVAKAGEARLSVAVRLEKTLPKGLIGVPVGIPGLQWIEVRIPSWYELSKHGLAGAA